MKNKLIKFLNLIPLVAVAPTIAACGGSVTPTPEPEEQFDYEELDVPTCVIKTEGSAPVVDRETYINATFTIANCDESQKLTNVSGQIRGRGNLSWKWPKKSYSIKFEDKQSVFGSEKKYKKWALIANYADTSLYRNYVAYVLANKLNKLIFYQSVHMVDLYLNDTYLGLYMFTDRIEAKGGRVDIDTSIAEDGNNGYLLEQTLSGRVEGSENVDWIKMNSDLYFQIKSPDTESEEYLPYASIETAYIKNYVQSCLDALTSNDWTQVDSLIDVDSFVDGYLIEELFGNLDCYRYSMFYYKDKDGKLCHGPVWDFDLSSGNVNIGPGSASGYKPDKRLWASEKNIFYKNLFTYQEFKTKVANRLVEFKSAFEEVMELLNPENENGYYLKAKQSIDRNFKKWKILGTNATHYSPIDVARLDTLAKHHTFLKEWLTARYAYMQEKIK